MSWPLFHWSTKAWSERGHLGKIKNIPIFVFWLETTHLILDQGQNSWIHEEIHFVVSKLTTFKTNPSLLTQLFCYISSWSLKGLCGKPSHSDVVRNIRLRKAQMDADMIWWPEFDCDDRMAAEWVRYPLSSICEWTDRSVCVDDWCQEPTVKPQGQCWQ